MPWKEKTTMSQRQEFVELALKESANIRTLCREFRITPRTGYKWIRRHQEQGDVGLYDRSRRPKHSPHKSSSVVEAAVLLVRRMHPAWGGRKIQWQLAQEGIKPLPAASTITAILSRNEMLDLSTTSLVAFNEHAARTNIKIGTKNWGWSPERLPVLQKTNNKCYIVPHKLLYFLLEYQPTNPIQK